MTADSRREWASRALTNAATAPPNGQHPPPLTSVGAGPITPTEVVGAPTIHPSEVSLVTDSRQRIIHISEGFSAVTGYVLDDVVGRTCGLLQGAGTDPATVRDMRQALRSGRAYEGELLNYRKDGAAFWNALRVMPLRLGAGQDVTHFVSVQREVGDRVVLLEQPGVQALRDAVTGLPDRRAGWQAAEAALLRRRPAGSTLVLGLIDLDDFRLLNRTYGHAAGDSVLLAWADRMRSRLQNGDVLARMDGDEFLLILARDDWDDAGRDLAAELDRLHGALDVPFTVGRHRITVGMSMGVATVRQGEADHHTVLRACDDALHRLKRDRAGRTRWWKLSDTGFAPAVAVPAGPPIDDGATSRPTPRDIRRALAAGGVEPHFQPVVDLRDGTVHLLEALARLRLDDGSLAQPSEFLSLLTRADEKLLFREMLHGALSALHAWDIAGNRENVSINISPVVLRDPTTPGVVYAALTAHGIAPSRLTLEILESEILDLDTQRAAIEELVSIGVTLAMDDLAAGHSSLQRLASFPFSALKLDRGLFDGVHERPLETLSIVATLIQVGRDLSMGVVVEGLEQEDLTEAAIILGAPLGQGYFFAQPLPAEKCREWMAEFSLTLHRSPIQTLLGALAYHWQFGRLNVTHPLPLDACPLTRFIRELDHPPDVERWHERQHQGQSTHPASSRALIAWLTRAIAARSEAPGN